MLIPHDSYVLVADGRKMLFFRNAGDGDAPNLQLVDQGAIFNPDTSEQGSDAPGRAFSSVGARRNAMAQTDFHQIEEDRFAAQAAAMLKTGALANDFEKLLIVAPPKTLGEMRKHYHKEVETRLLGEIAKDLTGHPVEEIEKIIAAA